MQRSLGIAADLNHGKDSAGNGGHEFTLLALEFDPSVKAQEFYEDAGRPAAYCPLRCCRNRESGPGGNGRWTDEGKAAIGGSFPPLPAWQPRGRYGNRASSRRGARPLRLLEPARQIAEFRAQGLDQHWNAWICREGIRRMCLEKWPEFMKSAMTSWRRYDGEGSMAIRTDRKMVRQGRQEQPNKPSATKGKGPC